MIAGLLSWLGLFAVFGVLGCFLVVCGCRVVSVCAFVWGWLFDGSACVAVTFTSWFDLVGCVLFVRVTVCLPVWLYGSVFGPVGLVARVFVDVLVWLVCASLFWFV